MATEEQQVNSPVKLNLGDVGKALDIASGGSMCMVLNGKNYLRLIHEKWHKISSIPAVRSFGLIILGPCGFKMLTKPLGIPHITYININISSILLNVHTSVCLW
jgi:hypothetical protein